MRTICSLPPRWTSGSSRALTPDSYHPNNPGGEGCCSEIWATSVDSARFILIAAAMLCQQSTSAATPPTRIVPSARSITPTRPCPNSSCTERCVLTAGDAGGADRTGFTVQDVIACTSDKTQDCISRYQANTRSSLCLEGPRSRNSVSLLQEGRTPKVNHKRHFAVRSKMLSQLCVRPCLV